MALTRKTASAIVMGGLAALVTFANPNYESRDLTQFPPTNIWGKVDYRGGALYNAGYAAMAAAGVGLLYNGLTGNIRRKD